MDHIGILKRAIRMTWRYRVLWLFGILLALVGGGGGGQGLQYSFGGNGDGRGGIDGIQGLPPGFNIDLPTVLALIAMVIVVLLIVAVISTFLRYIAETALIRLVDDIEETGREPGIRRGWRLGWSPAAWRIFLADLLVNLPFVIIAILAVLFALSPLTLFLFESEALSILAVILTIGLVLFVIGALILVGILINVWLLIARREIALNNRGVIDALRAAFGLIRRHLSNVAVLWLLMLAVGIGWGLLMIPVVILALLLAAVAGGVPGLIIYAIFGTPVSAIIVGLLLGLIAMSVPLTFLSGLYTAFVTAVWTIFFRELRARDALVEP